ncbi:diguanylate cyclase (GGDEF)-like protein [Neorhizobium sp. 2083]|uniref:sensor domain-containing diguanylate cyclase n=1 Tax=Neorhizobium sp. 2083 TaxID=2817762 RepID=UPI00285B39E5|nr:diguanylate cyclase [Neorhizobium sp. 2083]MDR6819941.1 diguanylate cyclase (GGDEF)-like protein [Neorhizobium sp. 2083]
MAWGDFFKGLSSYLLLVILAQLGASVANASDSTNIRTSCWASATLSEDIVGMARDEHRWSCSGTNQRISIEAERVLLRFDITPSQVSPRYLLSRRSALEAVHLLVIDQDGSIRQTSYPAAALQSSMAGGYFKAALPEVTRMSRQVVAAVDLPSHRMTLEKAYLSPTDAGASADDFRFLLLMAGLAGTLMMPLIFNAAFYRALREPFVLWHSALTVSLLMTIAVTSGLAVAFFAPPAMTLSWMTTLIFGITIGSGAMFTYSFIEPGLMHPILRRILPYCAAWAVFLSFFHATFPFVARPVQSTVYTAAFAPILAVFVLSLIDSLRRGSRAARFQAVGYAPLALVGLIRLVTGLTPGLQSADAMLMFYFGCMFEVLLTTLGVAERFVIMKRERDRARDEADLLERLSETDPLTGLLNRRAIERQFEQLRATGFTALAAIDLDHFKAINDGYGHGVGDEVLKAVGVALKAGPNVRAFRLGGEEFLLLLRGHEVDAQAELCREAIPATVAMAVPVLARPVTASMGITSISGDDDFTRLYERADKLLYEAKSAGRNRTLSLTGAVHLSQAGQNNRVMIA